MKPELRKEQGSPRLLRTGESIAATDLRVGDELICATKHGLVLVRVKHLKRSNGELVAFLPEAAPRIDPDKAIELKRIIKAWRSPESKRAAAEPGKLGDAP